MAAELCEGQDRDSVVCASYTSMATTAAAALNKSGPTKARSNDRNRLIGVRVSWPSWSFLN